MGADLLVTLDAVIVAVTGVQPRVLTVAGTPPALPSGPLSVADDETLELGMRRVIGEQTGVEVGYIEQLYTFGDRERIRSPGGPRVLSIAYLALVREASTAPEARWIDWYALLPWEDHREGVPAILTDHVLPRLSDWADQDVDRRARVSVSFGVDTPWDPIRALERYELLYEAGLVAEAIRDRRDDRPVPPTGVEMASDHRRICATALGRLRGKLTYRPVVFELMPDEFTLSELQRTVEALVGLRLHKQNFRRLVDREHLVEGTGRHAPSTGGRPAELYRFRRSVVGERPRPGMRLPPFRG